MSDGAHLHPSLEEQLALLRTDLSTLRTEFEWHQHPHEHDQPAEEAPDAPPALPWGFGGQCNVGRIDRVVEITDGDPARWHAESKVPWTLLLVKNPVTVRTTETFDPAEGVKWWGAPVTLDCRDNTWGVRIRQPHVYGGPTKVIPAVGDVTSSNNQASGLIIHPGAQHIFLANWTILGRFCPSGAGFDSAESMSVWRWPRDLPPPTDITLDRFVWEPEETNDGHGSKSALVGSATQTQAPDMRVTIARSVYGGWQRNPLVARGPFVHDYNNVRPRVNRRHGCRADDGGRIYSEHSYWHKSTNTGLDSETGGNGQVTLGDGTTVFDGAVVEPVGARLDKPSYDCPPRESEADVVGRAGV